MIKCIEVDDEEAINKLLNVITLDGSRYILYCDYIHVDSLYNDVIQAITNRYASYITGHIVMPGIRHLVITKQGVITDVYVMISIKSQFSIKPVVHVIKVDHGIVNVRTDNY